MNQTKQNFQTGDKTRRNVVAKSVQDQDNCFVCRQCPRTNMFGNIFSKHVKLASLWISDFPLSLDQFKVLVFQSLNCSPSSTLNLTCLEEEAEKDPLEKILK